MVMLSDAVAEKKGDGSAKEHVQVLDVAQILQQSLSAPPATPQAPVDPAPAPGPAPAG
jgi:hypothetical protein